MGVMGTNLTVSIECENHAHGSMLFTGVND